MRCTSDAARALCTARGQSAPCRRPHPRRDGAGQEPQTRASWHARCDGEGALQSIPRACSLPVPHTLSFTGSANLGDESDLERTKPNRGPPLPGNFCQIEETAFSGTVFCENNAATQLSGAGLAARVEHAGGGVSSRISR